MKIAVCDDNPFDGKKITEYLRQYSEENMLHYEVSEFTSGEALVEAFSRTPFQIVFLDIYMKELSGVDAAYRLRQQDKRCAIIFTTSSADFRADGFEVGAVHYLLKPVSYEGITAALERCSHLMTESERFFTVVANRQPVPIRIKEVIYTEVYKNQVLIHTTGGIITTYASLSEIAALLQDRCFLTCHRCYIVNMRYITGFQENDFILSSGERIPIRKNGRQQIKEAYSEYLFHIVKENLW